MIKQAIAAALLAALSATVALAAESDVPSAQAAPDVAAESAALVAKQTLAKQLNVAPETLTIESTHARTWSDSSLGCGEPGTVAMQVVTDGYVVTIAIQERQYRVHVAGSNAVVCSKPLLQRDENRLMTTARGLDVLIDKARTDLIQRLQADPKKIRLMGTQPQRWKDSGLDCPRADEEIVAGPLNGYRLTFEYRSRLYTYHADTNDVRACPPIESK